jgi:hypothetical protein
MNARERGTALIIEHRVEEQLERDVRPKTVTSRRRDFRRQSKPGR